MCEFCIKHGEGKKWYLQMKNYSEELLHAELSTEQKWFAKARTRFEYRTRSIGKRFAMTPANGVLGAPVQAPHVRPDEAEEIEVRKILHFGQVLPIEDVERVIDGVDSITRMACACRYISIGKSDKRYCFGFGIDKMGILGKFPDASLSLEVLEKEDAKKIIDAYDKQGLVHTIWTGITPYIVSLCNCDHDCMAYRGYIEQQGAPRFFRAEYICQVDVELCTGCKSCMRQCQFGAMFYSSALSKIYIDPARCFGCGVCRAVCANEAITLVPRKSVPKVSDVWLRYVPE